MTRPPIQETYHTVVTSVRLMERCNGLTAAIYLVSWLLEHKVSDGVREVQSPEDIPAMEFLHSVGKTLGKGVTYKPKQVSGSQSKVFIHPFPLNSGLQIVNV